MTADVTVLPLPIASGNDIREGLLLIANVLLLVVTAAQCYVAWRQREIMANQTELMSGELQVAREAAEAAATASDAARRSLVAQNPPDLVVREVKVNELRAVMSTERTLGPDGRDIGAPQLTGSFRLTNRGRHRAQVVQVNATMYFGQPDRYLPQHNPATAFRLGIEPFSLEPGDTTILELTSPLVTGEVLDALTRNERTLIAVGKIRYLDEFGRPRRTGFARVFDQASGRFTYQVFDDPDYEYSE